MAVVAIVALAQGHWSLAVPDQGRVGGALVGAGAEQELAGASGGLRERALADTAQWAQRQFGSVDLGDKRRNRRAVEVAARIAQAPEASLPKRMQSHAQVDGAYRLLSNPEVSMEALLEPHRQQTLEAARREPLVLLLEDSSELDYTKHRKMRGLGPIGDGRGRGLVMHETLALVPGPTKERARLLGLACFQVVLRTPAAQKRSKPADTPESRLWQESARQVGQPPEGVRWIHVSDCGSDGFEYMIACVQQGKGFVIRSYQDRRLASEEEAGADSEASAVHLHEYAASLEPREGIAYTVAVKATKRQPAREATVVVSWGRARLVPPRKSGPLGKEHGPLDVRVVRAWEKEPPEGAKVVQWLLLTTEPVETGAEALRIIDWYGLRWWCEDFHKCLKSGCSVQRAQLDRADDIRRLLGILAPVSVRLLQLRQAARVTPDRPAEEVVEPLMLRVLCLHQKLPTTKMTIREFFRRVAQLGGFLGRKCDGEPGWQTLWGGYEKLVGLTEGARLALGTSS